jgi:hypothetical protein
MVVMMEFVFAARQAAQTHAADFQPHAATANLRLRHTHDTNAVVLLGTEYIDVDYILHLPTDYNPSLSRMFEKKSKKYQIAIPSTTCSRLGLCRGVCSLLGSLHGRQRDSSFRRRPLVLW